MAEPTGPNPRRQIRGMEVTDVVRKLAERMAAETGGTTLRALADLRAAVEVAIKHNLLVGDVIDQDKRSWRDIGRDLGVSAQAAHQKYHRQRQSVRDESEPSGRGADSST